MKIISEPQNTFKKPMTVFRIILGVIGILVWIVFATRASSQAQDPQAVQGKPFERTGISEIGGVEFVTPVDYTAQGQNTMVATKVQSPSVQSSSEPADHQLPVSNYSREQPEEPIRPELTQPPKLPSEYPVIGEDGPVKAVEPKPKVKPGTGMVPHPRMPAN